MRSSSARNTALVALIALGLSACTGSTGQDDELSAARAAEPVAATSPEPEPDPEPEDDSDWASEADYLRDRDDRTSMITQLLQLTTDAIKTHAGAQTAEVFTEASLAVEDLVYLLEGRTPPDGYSESHNLLIESWRVNAQHFAETARAYEQFDDGPAFRAELRNSEDSLLESYRLKQASDQALP